MQPTLARHQLMSTIRGLTRPRVRKYIPPSSAVLVSFNGKRDVRLSTPNSNCQTGGVTGGELTIWWKEVLGCFNIQVVYCCLTELEEPLVSVRILTVLEKRFEDSVNEVDALNTVVKELCRDYRKETCPPFAKQSASVNELE